jgi:hypothetical protein
VDVNFQGPGLRNACRAAWGQVGPGGLCTHANECASGLCLDNERCYGPCTEDAACLEGSQCRQVPQEEGEDLQFCVSPPRQCSSDLDCEDGTLCLPALSEQEPDTIEGFCQVPTNPGGLLAGQGCTEDAQCASGACLGAGYCYGVCDAEANQGCNGGTRCYADTYRFTFDQGTEDLTDDRWDSTSSCGRNIGSFDLCQEDAQCPGTEICFPFTNRRYTGWETRCVLPFNVSGGTRGASCLSNSDCASNICLDFGFFTTMCLTVCNSDGDCAGFFTTCEAQEFIVDDRGTVTEEDDIVDTINICVP